MVFFVSKKQLKLLVERFTTDFFNHFTEPRHFHLYNPDSFQVAKLFRATNQTLIDGIYTDYDNNGNTTFIFTFKCALKCAIC
jgi:hypothetical protein